MKKLLIVLCSILGICTSLYSQHKVKLSLAEWSFHRAIQSGKMTNLDFPRITRTQFNIDAVEYVSTLFDGKASVTDTVYLRKLKNECKKYHVLSNLIMVDDEGNLGDTNLEKRNEAVQNHFKWVKAARFLGCHSIRVNAVGEGTPEEVQKAVIDGLSKLCDYASKYNINVIVENHWGNSSNPEWLLPAIKAVHKNNCGVLPDFGNFDKADRYRAVEQMMPYAKGVSAKSYDFDAQGNETKIDYKKMLAIIKKSGYTGFIGVEYEGERLTEVDGIKATIRLINNCSK
ncbi:MAG: sugar phosphate isomerase/epimerase family protein [Bacteroidota bacterium]|nr:sugar phosphate isomerase/epimerase family protein [Bacteroidota bacterium]